MTTTLSEEQMILGLAQLAIAQGWKPMSGDYIRPEEHTACAIGLACIGSGAKHETGSNVIDWCIDSLGWKADDIMAFYHGFDRIMAVSRWSTENPHYAMGQRIRAALLP